MEIDIRKSIRSNFNDATTDEFKTAIDSSIKDKEEVTLPGLGVFFEILWENSNENDKKFILDKIKKNI